MRRWIAAFAAVLFLATATLHVFAHHGAADADCGVCRVQQASLPSAAPPAVAIAPAPEAALSEISAPVPRSTRSDSPVARAPPLLRA